MSTERMFRTRGGAPGRYGKHVAVILADSDHERGLQADLARDLADLTDAARRDQDARLFLAASGRLAQVLGRMGVGGFSAQGGGDDDGGAGPDIPAGLAAALGGTPADGDNA